MGFDGEVEEGLMLTGQVLYFNLNDSCKCISENENLKILTLKASIIVHEYRCSVHI